MELTMQEKERVLTIKSEFPQDLFQKQIKATKENAIVRPSQSYWQDAFRRFTKNKQSLFAFALANLLLLFSFMGPLIWTKSPTHQDLNSPSMPPDFGETAIVVDESVTFEPQMVHVEESLNSTATVTETTSAGSISEIGKVNNFKIIGFPTSQSVVLGWDYVAGATGYVIYRNEVKPEEGSLGVPLGDITQGNQVSYEDIQSLEARDYYYSIVPKDANGIEAPHSTILKVKVLSAISIESAKELGVKSEVGSRVRLSSSPLGTDSLGRDILARLMSGGKVSLFIGIFASFFSVLFGIFLGGVSGFFGGNIDSVIMRFTDLISGLPFLLCMILLNVVLNVGPGESGITAMLISLVLLSWTGAARLVRGQILQLRNSEFIHAARMMGAKPGYLIVRHMLPNLIGVILVTLTFQIPSAIFTEAFLSFIGLGVASPATSWGSMCNEAIQTLLIRPYEFFAPSIVISLTVLSFNLLGDGLRDALDPKLRSNE
jgi:oligopeptide transport system permease protein